MPLEKTLQAEGLAAIEQWCSSFSVRRWAWMGRHVHEQTGLSTGAVTDNNELSSNLGHGDVRGMDLWGLWGGWRIWVQRGECLDGGLAVIEVGEQRLQGVLWLGTMAATGVVLQRLRLSCCLRHAALLPLRPSSPGRERV